MRQMLSLPSKKDTWAKVSGLCMGRARFTVIRPLPTSSVMAQGAESHLGFPAGSVQLVRDRHRLGTKSWDTPLDPQDTHGPVSLQPPLVPWSPAIVWKTSSCMARSRQYRALMLVG